MRVLGWLRLSAFAVETVVLATCALLGRLLAPMLPRAARWWATRCSYLWCRIGCACFGVRRVIHGRPPRGVFLAAANHLSYLDILVLGSLWPGVFVAKREIASWPLFGIAAGMAGTIFIDRDAPREVVEAGRQVTATLESGQPVTLFPEGRITTGASVLPFLPSLLAPAARGRVPCYAVSLHYESSEPGIDPSSEICWPLSTPLLPHALRVATLRDLRVTVHVSEDAVVSGDRKELAGRLHAWVVERFRPMHPPTAGPSCAP